MKKTIIVIVIIIVVLGILFLAALGYKKMKDKETAKDSPDAQPTQFSSPTNKPGNMKDSFKEFVKTAKGATEGDSGPGRDKRIVADKKQVMNNAGKMMRTMHIGIA